MSPETSVASTLKKTSKCACRLQNLRWLAGQSTVSTGMYNMKIWDNHESMIFHQAKINYWGYTPRVSVMPNPVPRGERTQKSTAQLPTFRTTGLDLWDFCCRLIRGYGKHGLIFGKHGKTGRDSPVVSQEMGPNDIPLSFFLEPPGISGNPSNMAGTSSWGEIVV